MSLIKKIKYISYNDKFSGFHKFQKQFILNIIKKNISDIICTNTFDFPIDFSINDFIEYQTENYEKNTLYIFNSIDYYYLTINATENNVNNITKFLELNNYIFFHYEVYTNDNLEQIGYLNYNSSLFSNGLIGDDRKDLICNFYKNANTVILQSHRNIEHLKQNYDCKNIVYFPCLGYSKINNFIPLLQTKKEIDLLFYGTISKTYTHRHDMILKLVKYSDKNNINFIYDETIYGSNKDEFLLKSKIVLHLPILLESKIAPSWCKIMELMCKKIFFIIEENDEIYKENLQNTIIFYKHNDFTDLTNKINYFLFSNEASNHRNEVVNNCYELVTNKYNIDEFVGNLISKY